MSAFLNTLTRLERLSTDRLNPNFTKIWIGGNNAGGKITLAFTIFDETGQYNLRFSSMRNFRNWKPDAKDQEIELNYLNDLVDIWSKTLLNEFIS